MEDEEEPVRENGFGSPIHPFQVASWIVFGADVLFVLAALAPLLEESELGVLLPLYVLSVVATIASTWRATRCNPIDPCSDKASIESAHAPADGTFCPYCQMIVKPRSKHCRVCNKCVATFDHHCNWINNCVGEANYASFFIAISSVAAMIAMLLGTVAYLVALYFTDALAFEYRVGGTALLAATPKELILAILLLFGCFNAPLLLVDVQLMMLHCFLMSQRLTTHEYVKNKQAEEESGSGGTSLKGRLRIKKLPSCMDWIFFSRCGRKRRQPRGEEAPSKEAATEEAAPQAMPRTTNDGPAPVEATDAPASPERCQGSPWTVPTSPAALEAGEGEMAITL